MKSNEIFMKILITKGALNSGSRSVWIRSFVCQEQSGSVGLCRAERVALPAVTLGHGTFTLTMQPTQFIS